MMFYELPKGRKPKPKKTIAFAATAESPIWIWCTITRKCKNGAIYFHVINGGWDGKYLNGEIFLPRSHIAMSQRQCVPVWEGICPHAEYDDAMPWIDEQRGFKLYEH